VIAAKIAAAAAFSAVVSGSLSGQAASSEAPAVVAPSNPRLELARTHFLRGVEFYRHGDFRLALVEFRRSYELSQNYAILYNVGQVNHQLNNYADALGALQRYLKEGGARVPEERRAEVQASITELEKRVARVRLRLNLDGVELSIDDASLGRIGRERWCVVDPGDHRIEVRHPGYRPLRRTLSVTAGDTAEVSLVLEPERLASSARAAPSEQQRGSAWVAVGWVTTGVLAAGAGVSGFLAVKEARDLSELRSSPDSTEARREWKAERARGWAIAADALAGAAVVSGALSLYVTLSGSERAPEQASTRLGFGPGGVSFSGSY
jgi:PEGA domain